MKVEIDTDKLIEMLKEGIRLPTAVPLDMHDHGDRMYLMGKYHAAQAIAGCLAYGLTWDSPAFKDVLLCCEGRPWDPVERAKAA